MFSKPILFSLSKSLRLHDPIHFPREFFVHLPCEECPLGSSMLIRQ
ncbi:MAG: hypothetical protein ACETVY_00395 [Candidatus Bathyarchaeia archaeon]